jgi:glucose/arabinose dehydrogenase
MWCAARRQQAIAAAISCVVLTACGGNNPPSDNSGDATEVSGSERLGWDQRAASQADLSSLKFFIYVDGANRQEIASTSCNALNADGVASCSGQLPTMTSGAHALSLAAVDASGIESPRSDEIQVRVVRRVTAAAAAIGTEPAASTQSLRTSDGLTLMLEPVATGLSEPTDLAVMRDGRVLVAERRGLVKVVASDGDAPRPVLALADVDADRGDALLGLALDPAFDRTGQMYAVYTTESTFRLARFREEGGAFAERAVLLDAVDASATPSAALRFGPDGKLYAAFDDADDGRRSDDWGSYNGKVLRLNPDGTVPSDQEGFSPVSVSNLNATRSIAWTSEGSLWVAEGRALGSGRLDVVPPSDRLGRRGRIGTRYRLPDGETPSSVIVYHGDALKSWTGDLLVALPDSQRLLRFRLDANDRTHVVRTDVVIDGTAGAIRAIALDNNGRVYVASDDRLMRLAPKVVDGL